MMRTLKLKIPTSLYEEIQALKEISNSKYGRLRTNDFIAAGVEYYREILNKLEGEMK